MMDDPHSNFYDIQAAFNAEYGEDAAGYTKGVGWKQFRRWEGQWENKLYPTGQFPTNEQLKKAHLQKDRLLKLHEASGTRATANWRPIGPKTIAYGNGRVNVIEVDPTDTNTIYIGAPSGGIWKTTDYGSNWTPMSDFLPTITVSGISVNPLRPQTIYINTGDFNHWAAYGTGVWKSTDGGVTWNTTGLSFDAVNDFYRGGKIEVNPNDTNIVLATSHGGLYRSTNAGATWTEIINSDVEDFEFKPGNPSIVYAVSTSGFHKSTNAGASFASTATGLTGIGSASRLQVAVTPANANVVYIVGGGSETQSWKSTNSGNSFIVKHDGSTGNPLTGQIWYDMALDISPLDDTEIYAAGVRVFRSTDEGLTYDNIHSGSGMHVDVHWVQFFGNTLYCGNDGGIYRSYDFGDTWNSLTLGLQISQYYAFSCSGIDTSRISAGAQDNGTHLRMGGTWDRYAGGDGMETEIDYTNPDIIYFSYQNGSFSKTINATATSFGIFGDVTEGGAWTTPFQIDPVDHNTVYGGFENVWKSTDGGATSFPISSFGGGFLDAIKVAPSDPDIIYTSDNSTLYKTINGGTTWTTVSSSLPNNTISSIEIHPQNPDRVWLSFETYSTGTKVYSTDNGGSTWTNISGALPDFPAHRIIYQNGHPDDCLYLATENGVYYLDNTLPDWIPHMTGLPNVYVEDIEIPRETNVLRIATYGRGVWESDLVNTVAFPPSANFTADILETCPNQPITFNNTSLNSTAVIQWQFPGGVPATSTAANPSVIYSGTGVYDATLIVTNGSINDTITQTSYISIVDLSDVLDISEGFPLAVFPANWTIDNPDGALTWEPNPAVGGFGVNTGSMYVNNYSYSGSNNLDYIYTPTVDFSAAIAPMLTFDVAYAPFDYVAYIDTMAVYWSGDCGLTLNKIWEKGGSDLETAPAQGSVFTPSGSQWRTEMVDLSILPPVGEVKIYFENRGNYGNSLYLDNINLMSGGLVSIANPLAEGSYKIYPNPSSGRFSVEVYNEKVSAIVVKDILGISIFEKEVSSSEEKIDVDLSSRPAGLYLVELRYKSGFKVERILLEK